MNDPVSLGPYELTRRLGSGGMGDVHEARDTRLDRTVALKALPVDIVASPEARARFLREAKLAAALNHPNIVTIYEADVARSPQGDQLCIAMERVVGQTLAQRLRQKPPDTVNALEWAVQVAEALAHAWFGRLTLNRQATFGLAMISPAIILMLRRKYAPVVSRNYLMAFFTVYIGMVFWFFSRPIYGLGMAF